MPKKVGELYNAYAESNDVTATAKTAVDAANAEFEESRAAGDIKKKEFVDGIKSRPDPRKLIVLFDANGKPFVVVPDDSPDGFGVHYADDEETEIEEPGPAPGALPLTKAAGKPVLKPEPKSKADAPASPFGKGV